MDAPKSSTGKAVECGNCYFFSNFEPKPPTPADKWSGICKRFPVHARVNTAHSCGEFQRFTPENLKPGIRFVAHKGEPVTINAPSLSSLSDPPYFYRRPKNKPRKVRPTTKNSIGNSFVELTPLEAAVVEWALRIQVYNLQLADPLRGPGAYTTQAEIKHKLGILNGVIDRFEGDE